MEESILKFAEQFSFSPNIENSEKLQKKYDNFILGGMGGSHLAAGILKTYNSGINLYIHRDYGIPKYYDSFNKGSLFVAVSHSGNTEEVYDFADEAYSKGYDLIIISTGGKLIDFAVENNLPYIKIPNNGIQPRVSLGYLTLALSYVVNPGLLPELHNMKNVLKPEILKDDGLEIAKVLQNKIPVIYTANQNKALAYNWKIKINETGKIPAFYNVFPELNHNEMQGFDFVDSNKDLSKNFHFLFIIDAEDHPRIQKRMEVLESQIQEKGLSVNKIYLSGKSKFEKIFNSLLLADWVAVGLSGLYGTEPEQVPLIEDFKKRIK